MIKVDVIIGLIINILAFLIFLDTSDYPAIKQGAILGLGPAFFPRFLAILLFLLGTSIGVTAFSNKSIKVFQKLNYKELLVGIICIAIVFLYIIIIPYVGFIIATLFFSFIFIRLLGSDSLYKSGIVAIVITAGMFIVFQLILKMSLPTGVVIGG